VLSRTELSLLLFLLFGHLVAALFTHRCCCCFIVIIGGLSVISRPRRRQLLLRGYHIEPLTGGVAAVITTMAIHTSCVDACGGPAGWVIRRAQKKKPANSSTNDSLAEVYRS